MLPPSLLVFFFSRSCNSGFHNCVTQLKLYTFEKLSNTIFCCLWVSQASVSPDQISTFSNIYRHTSPLLTIYHLISSSTNLYWPSTSQYRHILTQHHQVPLIIHHLVRHSSANWIISLFTTHLMSHAQYTWSRLYYRRSSYFFYILESDRVWLVLANKVNGLLSLELLLL